jgi:histidinol phosphatase-like enzyme (inositol monophosphatase family)
MSASPQELEQLRDFATRIAKAAGEITLTYFNQLQGFETKEDGSFVTVADRETEAFLRAEIERELPDDGILGEEWGELTGRSGRRWILDPIDGTYSFVHGVAMYGVLVGLEIEGEPSVGVINIPAAGELLYAARGTGCFWNGKPARVSSTATLEEALLLATDFASIAAAGYAEAGEELQRRAAGRRTWGDCYGHVLVATGRADVILDPIMKIWDCAALLPVVEEAGGTFTDWRGERTISGGSAVSTNGLLHETVLDVIRRGR